MEERERYLARIIERPSLLGLSEVRFIHTPQVVTNNAIRLRCQYACAVHHASTLSPPATPIAAETRGVLDEYKFGVMVRREADFAAEPPAAAWASFEKAVLEIERECFLRGYAKAFAIGVGTCLFQHHDAAARPCEYAGKSRPTLEAVGIDLAATFDFIGWEKYIVREPGAPFQLFALLILN